MGWMKLLEATVKTVTKLPVAIVKDVVTLGNLGDMSPNAKTFTGQACEEISGDIDEIAD